MKFRTSFILWRADAQARSSKLPKMFRTLGKLSLRDFAGLMLSPPAGYPNLQAKVPPMASDEAQKLWTGSCGEGLLVQSIEFVQLLEDGYSKHLGKRLQNVDVLDFGCGWGRLVRLLYRYTSPDRIYAVDPWEDSLEACRTAGLPGHFALSDYLPRELPFGATKFDLIYSFSVFTHLSPRAMQIAQSTLRSRIKDHGLLVATIRPPEFWNDHQYWRPGYTPEGMIAQHKSEGIAFLPHDRALVEGEVTYGDTSMTLGYLEQHWSGWRVVETRPLIQDPNQLVVYLVPR